MPVSKPTTLPEWATSGSADITEPLLAEKQTGWIGGEAPPAQFFNWWMKLVYQWMTYVNDLPNQVITWIGAQTFNAVTTFLAAISGTSATFSLTVTGNSLVATNTVVAGSDITAVGDITAGDAITAGGQITGHDLTINAAGAVNLPVQGKTTLGTGIAGYPKPTAWKGAEGEVHIEGAFAFGGDIASGTAFATGTVPSGFRPTAIVRAVCYAENAAGDNLSALISINTNGSISAEAIGVDFKSIWFNVVYLPSIAGGP
jgi:hypothetical protein